MKRQGKGSQYPCMLLIIELLALLGFTFAGCGRVIFGDPAQVIKYENRLDEAVTISYRFDGVDKVMPGVTIRPHSEVQEPVVIRGRGVRIQAITKSGAVVFDRHYTWEEFPKGEVYTIVIE